MFIKMKNRLPEIIKKHPIASGIAIGAGQYVQTIAIKKLGEKIDIPLQHGRSKNERRLSFFSEHPAVSALGVTALVPLAEELFWRELPERLSQRHEDLRPVITLGALGLFAAQHAGKDGIPLSQAIGGFEFKQLHDAGGLKASVAAHVTHNTLAAAHYLISKKIKL